jgi:predicted transcriptional regulator
MDSTTLVALRYKQSWKRFYSMGAKDMQPPEGRLSPAQYEIIEAIWDVGPPGATSLQIWERITKKRKIIISTTINLVNRLEARGWLNRIETDGPITFWPTQPRDQIEADMAEDFVECFFGGSASQLIMSLFGREKISPDEVQHLREVYDKQTDNPSGKKKPKRSRKRGK